MSHIFPLLQQDVPPQFDKYIAEGTKKIGLFLKPSLMTDAKSMVPFRNLIIGPLLFNLLPILVILAQSDQQSETL